MKEVLLRPNVRILYGGMIPPAVVVAAGAALGLLATAVWLAVIGWVLAAFGVVAMATLFWLSLQPRLAYRDGRLLVYVQFGGPTAVPLDVVECVFLGTGPMRLPGERTVKTANLVMRLAEKETEWVARPAAPQLARWGDGYITLYGAWCEPLSIPRVQLLNQRMHDIKQQIAAHTAPPAPAT